MSKYGFFNYEGKYNPDRKNRKSAGPSSAKGALSGKSTVGDWNRMFDVYHINGVPLSTLRHNKEFENSAELKKFLKSNLANKVNPIDQEKLADLALMHFHQAGLPHAVAFSALYSINSSQEGLDKTVLLIEQPEMRVDFTATCKGIVVSEQLTYKNAAIIEGAAVPINETTSKGHVLSLKSEAILTTKAIQLTKLEMDCPHKVLSKILDKRSLLTKIIDFLGDLFKSSRNEEIAPNQDKKDAAPTENNADLENSMRRGPR